MIPLSKAFIPNLRLLVPFLHVEKFAVVVGGCWKWILLLSDKTKLNKNESNVPWSEFCMIWVLWHLSDGFSRELLSLSHPSDQDLSWKGSPHPKIEEKK